MHKTLVGRTLPVENHEEFTNLVCRWTPKSYTYDCLRFVRIFCRPSVSDLSLIRLRSCRRAVTNVVS